MARRDPHSYADDTQLETQSLDWSAHVDFASRTITGVATLTFRAPGGGALDLDTRDLRIDAITDARGAELAFTLHPAEPHLGSRLAIQVPPDTERIVITYRTSPDASALQWLTPAQTRGGTHPYVFSQCQAIHARSLIPLQDTPRLRIRYTAKLVIPRALRAVMAAAHDGRTERGDDAMETFHMPQPIPPYLLAFAIGDLASRDLSPRCRVWAEPAQLPAALLDQLDQPIEPRQPHPHPAEPIRTGVRTGGTYR